MPKSHFLLGLLAIKFVNTLQENNLIIKIDELLFYFIFEMLEINSKVIKENTEVLLQI